MKIFVNDIFKLFNIEKTQLNVTAVKALIAAMSMKKMCIYEKQKIIFDENVFLYCWDLYQKSLNHFDPNYNRKTDFSLYFKYIIDSKYENKTIDFHALFCPGYTKYGYKNKLGNTTVWKLKELYDIMNMYAENKIKTNLTCYYSDDFLENCDQKLEPNWREQLERNRCLFHEEGEKYFQQCDVKNMSDIEIFSSDRDIEGYVDYDIIRSIPKTTYSAFKKGNEKFYKSMGFSEEQINFRNDRLITMYRIFSDYLNTLENTIFLPMENMYERENIFSENNTCTMYLKLKR